MWTGSEPAWRSHWVADPEKAPRPLSTASWFAISGLALVGLANLIRLGTAVALHGGTHPVDVADLLSLEDLHRSFATWSELALIGDLLAAAMFIPWFAMAYSNLRRLGVQRLRWSNGWAVGAWFVPILSLFRPKQIANDIWRGSEAGIDVSSERWRSGPVSPIVHWWWGLFLAGGAVAAIGSSAVQNGYTNLVHTVMLSRDTALTTMRTGSLIAVLGAAGLIAAAVLGVMFVRGATARFEAIRQQLAVAGPVQAPGQVPPPSYFPGPANPAPPSVPLQDLVRCPECAEFVPPGEACRYCGASLSAKR